MELSTLTTLTAARSKIDSRCRLKRLFRVSIPELSLTPIQFVKHVENANIFFDLINSYIMLYAGFYSSCIINFVLHNDNWLSSIYILHRTIAYVDSKLHALFYFTRPQPVSSSQLGSNKHTSVSEAERVDGCQNR